MNSVPATADAANPQPPAKVAVGTGGKIAPFVPTSLEETWRLSTVIAQSQMAPKSYNNDPNRIMVGIMAGLELGLTPFTALQSIAVIGNNPSVWGDGALALVEASGLLEYCTETFDDATETAICTLKRLGKPSETVRTFSFVDAKKAGLIGKQGPWQGYPKRMCQMRARAFALRDTFADVLKGIGIAEEVRDWAGEGAPTRSHTENRLSSAMLFGQAQPQGEVVEGQATETLAEALDDEIPAHVGGMSAAPAEDFAEEAQVDDAPAWKPHVDRIQEAIGGSKTLAALGNAETEFLNIRAGLPDDVVDAVEAEIKLARELLGNSKKGN